MLKSCQRRLIKSAAFLRTELQMNQLNIKTATFNRSQRQEADSQHNFHWLVMDYLTRAHARTIFLFDKRNGERKKDISTML